MSTHESDGYLDEYGKALREMAKNGELQQLRKLRSSLTETYGDEDTPLPEFLIADAADQLDLRLLQAYESLIPHGYDSEEIESAHGVIQRIGYNTGALTLMQIDTVMELETVLGKHVLFPLDEGDMLREEYDPLLKLILDNTEYSAQLISLIKDRAVLDANQLESYLPEIKNQHAATFEGVL